MINIPNEICVNNNVNGLSIRIYLILKISSLKENKQEISVNIKALMDLCDIRDKRTFTKCTTSLTEHKLLFIKRQFNNGREMTIFFPQSNHYAYGVNHDVIENLLSLKNNYSVKVYFFYKYCVLNGKEPTQQDIKKALQMGGTTTKDALDALKEFNMFEGIETDAIEKDPLISIEIPSNIIRNEEVKKYYESELERELIDNLSLIEEGMSFIKNQVYVKEGIIDILAKDKKGRLCIIEVKIVSDDEKLVFQSVYYPTQILGNPRMITVAPDYEYKIKASLQSLGYVEMKRYTFENDKLTIANYN